MGLSAIIFTDVERDGMGTGMNWEMTRSYGQSHFHSCHCIRRHFPYRKRLSHLKKLEPEGVIGVIVGRALYTGQIDLEEAIRVAEDSEELTTPIERSREAKFGALLQTVIVSDSKAYLECFGSR